jgi:hypothetical protein
MHFNAIQFRRTSADAGPWRSVLLAPVPSNFQVMEQAVSCEREG